MKEVIFALMVLLFTSCSAGVESIIEDVYGDGYESERIEENEVYYYLDYSNKRDVIEYQSLKFKDKIDAYTNTLSRNPNEFAYHSDANSGASEKADCISTTYEWETPTIRVLLIIDRCIPDEGNKITIAVTNK